MLFLVNIHEGLLLAKKQVLFILVKDELEELTLVKKQEELERVYDIGSCARVKCSFWLSNT